MSDTEEEKKIVEDCSNPDVVTKYNAAGGIVGDVIQQLAELCVDGANIKELCEKGDALVVERTGKLYKKNKKLTKGIAFPTCISVNEIVGHNSPCPQNISSPNPEDPAIIGALKTGDLVKIDLGAHLDGYAAVSAHSLVVGGEATGPAAAVMAAAETAAELAHRMLKAGNKNTAITEMFAKVASDFGVNVVQGVLSHTMNRHVIDGEKCIISKADHDNKVEEFEFQPNDVYAIDIVMSTGEGKPKNTDAKPSVFKRNIDKKVQLKLRGAREVLTYIQANCSSFPFTINSFPTTLKTRLGISSMLKHELIQAYPVLTETNGITAHVKFTAMILPGGTARTTKGPFTAAHGVNIAEKLQDADLKALLATSANKKKKKKKKNKKKSPAAE